MASFSNVNGLKLFQWPDLTVGVAYSQGWRIYMQDRYSLRAGIHEGVDFVGVFDGHDIHGDKVAQYVAEYLPHYATRRMVKGNPMDVPRVIQRAFLDFDLHMKSATNYFRGEIYGGSTAVCLWISKGRIISANTGDSRAIMSINGKAVPLTSDHKPYNPTERSRIVSAGGFVSQNRVQGILALSRAFGDYEMKNNTRRAASQQAVTALPDVRVFDVQPGLEFIVLGSDGLWDILSNQQTVDFVWDNIRQRISPDVIAFNVVRKCLAPMASLGSMGRDNITVLVCVPNPSR